MVYKVFDKKSASICANVHANNERPLDLATQKLAEELHKTLENLKKNNSFFRILKKCLGFWFSWYAINKQI